MDKSIAVNKKLVGRPRFSLDRVKKLEYAFSSGLNVTEACLLAGISRQAFYTRVQADDDFKTRMESAQLLILTKAKQNIAIQIVNNHDIELSKWWIDRKDQDFTIGVKDKIDVEPDNTDYKAIIHAYECIIKADKSKIEYYKMKANGTLPNSDYHGPVNPQY